MRLHQSFQKSDAAILQRIAFAFQRLILAILCNQSRPVYAAAYHTLQNILSSSYSIYIQTPLCKLMQRGICMDYSIIGMPPFLRLSSAASATR